MRIVRERELGVRRVTRLSMIEQVEQLGVVLERARNGAETADVLGMEPAGVVEAAVGAREIG
jgi:hypothetical protein